MRLFSLPDLSEMEVAVILHETVVDRVGTGMSARVRVDALPGREIEGRVLTVSPFPAYDEESANQIPQFVGTVRLLSVPTGLRPGMSAELEILTSRRLGVLAVPPAAVAREGRQNVCYVAHAEQTERRPVKLGARSRGLLEVVDGLAEGELVIIDPSPKSDSGPQRESATAQGESERKAKRSPG
jgi:HlyD family secretion protein